MISGWSGSALTYWMITSWPIRGMAIEPQLPPAQLCETRTQQELNSLPLLSRSQGKLTLTRPHSSQSISSPGGPTTVAMCGPSIRGLARGRAPFAGARHQHGTLHVAGALVGAACLFLQAGELHAFMVHADRPPMHVQVFARVPDKRETQPWLQAYIIALHLGNMRVVAQRREARGRERYADRVPLVAPRVVETLVGQRLMGMLLSAARCSWR